MSAFTFAWDPKLIFNYESTRPRNKLTIYFPSTSRRRQRSTVVVCCADFGAQNFASSFAVLSKGPEGLHTYDILPITVIQRKSFGFALGGRGKLVLFSQVGLRYKVPGKCSLLSLLVATHTGGNLSGFWTASE